jgi:outer membrane protein assembly factor BamB
VGDLLYFVDDATGFTTCVEAASGKEVWRERLAGKAFSAAPLYGDDKLYFSGEDGTTTVLRAGRTFKRLAENKLDDGIRATIAVSGKALFLRTQTNVYRIEE